MRTALKVKFVPQGYNLVFKDDDLNAEIYHGESRLNNGMPTSLRFVGKSTKPCQHYRYKDAAERLQHDEKFLTQVKETAERKAKEQAERKALRSAPHGLNLGDIFVSSWGWEQTNVDFYQVVGFKGKSTVLLREIGMKSVGCEGSSMSDMVVAVKDKFIGDIFEKRIDSRKCFNVSSCQYARLWDGSKMYRSWYA